MNRGFAPVALLLFCSATLAAGRIILNWSYQELMAKSDLVVIASVASTRDTEERVDFPGFPGQHVVGIETTFAMSATLKGSPGLKSVVLHHYRRADSESQLRMPGSPTFLKLPPSEKPNMTPRAYLLFLKAGSDGRYEPVVGQVDPALSVRELIMPTS